MRFLSREKVSLPCALQHFTRSALPPPFPSPPFPPAGKVRRVRLSPAAEAGSPHHPAATHADRSEDDSSIAFITYYDLESCHAAIQIFNGCSLGGREVAIAFGVARDPSTPGSAARRQVGVGGAGLGGREGLLVVDRRLGAARAVLAGARMSRRCRFQILRSRKASTDDTPLPPPQGPSSAGSSGGSQHQYQQAVPATPDLRAPAAHPPMTPGTAAAVLSGYYPAYFPGEASGVTLYVRPLADTVDEALLWEAFQVRGGGGGG